MAATLAQKIWKQHLISQVRGRDLLYVDLHLVHELSPQAFGGLDLRGLPVRRPDQTAATTDHNVSTVTWGTTPAMSVPVSGHVPTPDQTANPAQTARALAYMGLAGGERIVDIPVDRVFIGSCTNSRIEDLRAAASVVAGQRVAGGVRAMVVPGSITVKLQAEREGLDAAFRDAGFEWREPGCSMCLGMNADTVGSGEWCASTSNRNFEGRQGRGARTHLVSPEMAAAAAVAGHFVDVRKVV